MATRENFNQEPCLSCGLGNSETAKTAKEKAICNKCYDGTANPEEIKYIRKFRT